MGGEPGLNVGTLGTIRTPSSCRTPPSMSPFGVPRRINTRWWISQRTRQRYWKKSSSRARCSRCTKEAWYDHLISFWRYAGAHICRIVHASRTDVHRESMRIVVPAADQVSLGERGKPRHEDGKAHPGRRQLDHFSEVRSFVICVGWPLKLDM